VPDPTRLNELRRQRELVAEHLAWIDREIASAAGGAAAPPAPAAQPAPAPVAAPQPALRLVTPRPQAVAFTPAALPTGPAPDPDALLDEFRVPPDTLKTDVRKGCLLYFLGAFALLALGVTALYFIFRAGK
jgi:hypothetical protein